MTEAIAIERKSAKSQAMTEVIKSLPLVIEGLHWTGRNSEEHRLRLGALIEKVGATHPAIAKKLSRHLDSQLRGQIIPVRPDELLTFATPRFGLDAVALPESVKTAVLEIQNEFGKREQLAAAGLTPRNRILISGPPGNGKSMLGEALADLLELPFLRVRYGGLVDSHLGVTSRNIDRLMAYVSSAPCLVFWDEFDGVAISRNQGSDVTEMRRVTNQMLIALDQFSPNSVLVAATNEDSLIDKAVVRRFDVQITLPAPTDEVALQCAVTELAKAKALMDAGGWNVEKLAHELVNLAPANLSSLVHRCVRIRRDLVLCAGRGIAELVKEPI